MEEAFLLVKPTGKELPPKTLIRSGLDAVIWFDCPLKECQRRADGRRIDCDEIGKSETTFYHVNDRVPVTNCAPLCERLEPMDEDWDHSSSLVDRVVSFDMQEMSLRKWLHAFGVEERQYCLLQSVNGNATKESVFEQISAIIGNILDNKQIEKEAVREMFVIKLRQLLEEKAKQLAQEAADQMDQSFEDGELNRTGEISKMSETKREGVEGSRRSKELVKGGESNEASIDVGGKSALTHNISNASIMHLPERDNLDGDFKPVIIEVWRELARNYKRQMRRAFRNIRLQREQASHRSSELKTAFLEFLHTTDGKQAILDEFVKSFNTFSDEYPDLREDDQTKEELH